MQTIAYNAVLLWHKCRVFFRHCCPRNRPKVTEYESTWYMVGKEGVIETVKSPRFDENFQIAYQRVVRTRPDGRMDARCALWHRVVGRRLALNQETLFDHVPPPWLLLTKDDVDFTEECAEFVAKGNLVTLDFLNTRYGHGEWKYVNPGTFEECEFPSCGILIE